MMKYNIFTVINRVKPLLSVTNRVKPWLMLMLLTATTALSQNTHKLHLVVKPDYVFTVQLNCYETAATDGRGNFTSPRISSQTGGENALYVDMTADVPAGGGIWMQIQGTSASAYPFQYKLLGWTANGQPVELSEKMSGYRAYYMWEMPDEDVELVGRFEFDPTTYPGENTQPGTGSWDPETGTLICDYNGQMPLGFNTSTDGPMVQTLIEAGDNYANGRTTPKFNADAFPNCTTWDMSRTNATSVYAQNCALKTVILPSTITDLSGGYVFRGTALETLVLYATTPPSLNSNKPFPDSPDLMVRVPAESVPLYKAAPIWKDLNIVAMDEDYVNLHVQLMATPDSATIAQYKNMYLDLISIESGVTHTQLVNVRNSYAFRYLPTNTAYNVVLRTAEGNEIARIGNIYLGTENKTVTFDELKTPHTLLLTLLGSDNQPVDEALYTATWMKADGTYLKRGNNMENVLDGQHLLILPTIGAELAKQYAQPDTVNYTVGQDADHHLQLILPVQPVTTATFTAIDSLTHRPISDVTVDVAQVLFNGETGTRSLLTTGSDGKATGQVLATMSTITMTSPQHGSLTFNANLADSTAFRRAFIEANGTTIMLNHTYQAAVKQNETPVVENYYSEGRSLEYTFTATLPDGRDSVMTDYLLRYPMYTFYNTLPVGTKVRVSAVSTKDDIEPVEAEGTVGEQATVSVTLPIVQRGSLYLDYKRSESINPAALLFNATTGQLVKKQMFGDRTFMTFENLPAGDYLVAAMSKGPQYLSVNSRAQLEQYVKDKDYVAELVTIGEGRITEATFQKVPIAMTQLETNLTVRRTTCTYDNKVGYYAEIGVQIAFKGNLKERIYGSIYDESKYPTDCKLEVYIPKGFGTSWAYCSYRYYYYWPKGKHYGYQGESVSGGSLDELMKMDGISILGPGSIYMHICDWRWNEAERKLTVHLPHYDEGGKVQISMQCQEAGTFTPEIYLAYKLNGKEYREALETSPMIVSKSSIAVPETVVTEGFKVVGTAMYYEPEDNSEQTAASRMNGAFAAALPSHSSPPPYYAVTVMDGETPIGKAQIKEDGTWTADCKLVNPTTNSKHNIYAVITPKKADSQGWQTKAFTYQTECKTVTYDPNAVVPLWTRMSFFNHHPEHLVSTDVLFDYVNMKASPESYGYSNEEGYNTDFTFEVNLSNNDTTKVYACALHIWTDGPDGGEVITWAHYNARKGHWIAYEKFNTQAIPNSVYVEPFYYEDVVGSRVVVDNFYKMYEYLGKSDEKIEALLERINEVMDQGNKAYEKGEPVPIDELRALNRQLSELMGIEGISNDIPMKTIEEIQAETDSLNKETGIDQFLDFVQKPFNELGEVAEGLTVSTADGMTAESMEANGYISCSLDNGSVIYILCSDNGSWTYVDLERNIKIVMDAHALARRYAASDEDKLKKLSENTESLRIKINDMENAYYEAKRNAETKIESYTADIRQLDRIIENEESGWLEVAKAETKKAILSKLLEKFSNILLMLTELEAKALAGVIVNAKSAFDDLCSFGQQAHTMLNLRHTILGSSCLHQETNQELQQLGDEIVDYTHKMIDLQTALTAADLAGVAIAYWALMATFGGGGPSSATVLTATVAGIAASLYTSIVYNKEYRIKCNYFNTMYNVYKKRCDLYQDCLFHGNCPKCVRDGSCPHWPTPRRGPYPPTTDPTLDPSGFVYEGVESNRLEGVTTTVFYKTTEKNLFGEEVEKVTIWDAERYNQINPQLTDENGEYGWMVPTGWWQVKYEKDGYQTEYSEWLPVPPPQLDVNQPMTSIAQPMVSDVKATTQAVTVTFDKYMLADSLTDARIFVTRNGQKVSGTLDKLVSDDDPMQTLRPLTNKVRFVPTTALPAGQKLTLTVKGDVQSYAGVEMGNDFSQEFDIKATVEKIVADSTINVLYDQGTALTLQAQPAAAAAGKKVKARILSDMIASLTSASNGQWSMVNGQYELTLDAQGKATIVITGEAHGTTALILEMADDADIQTVVTVTVREQGDFVCPMPVSDYQPSQAYPAGTQISLLCSLPSATILYTTDGSCPCSDGNNVITYTGPITLMADMVIKAIARAPGYEDSDIAELTFMVEGSGSDTPVTYLLVVADAGYATFYDSQRAYQMPAGLTASTVSGISGGRLNYQQLSGSIIPQATAVLIEAQQKQAATYTLTSTVADGSAVSTNLLHGSDNATTTYAGQEDAGGYLFYKLAYGPSNTSLANSFGWFWGAQQGAPFSIEGHRAWLAVPKQAGARAYLINGESADIQYVELPQQQSGQVTDLQGRRLDKPTQPGIYIKDGRKVVVGGLRPK